jgi:hypothetical protein
LERNTPLKSPIATLFPTTSTTLRLAALLLFLLSAQNQNTWLVHYLDIILLESWQLSVDTHLPIVLLNINTWRKYLRDGGDRLLYVLEERIHYALKVPRNREDILP